MTLAQLRDAVDGKLAILWPRIVNRQETFFTNHGRYWQGLWTHSNPPNTTTADASEHEDAPDNLSDRPTNETTSWADVPQFPALLAYRILMDAWHAPDGHGFTGTIQVRHNGIAYSRSKSFPDDRYTESWHRLTEPA